MGFSSRLINAVSRVFISGQPKTVLYTELNTEYKIGDKVYVVNGNYDTNDLIQANPYIDGANGYTILDISKNSITIDFTYTGDFPWNTDDIDSFIKVYAANDIYEEGWYIIEDTIRTTINATSSNAKFADGQNNILFVSGSQSFYKPLSDPPITSDFDDGTLNNLDDNNDRLLIMDDFIYNGDDFRKGYAYKYDDTLSKWVVDTTYNPAILGKLNWRSGNFKKGAWDDGIFGSLTDDAIWEGATWKTGILFNADWQSGTMQSKSDTTEGLETHFAVVDGDEVNESSDTSNNIGHGYNYVIDSTMTLGFINNANVINSVLDSGFSDSVVEDYVTNVSSNLGLQIKKGRYESSTISGADIKTGTFENSTVKKSLFETGKSIDSTLERSVFKGLLDSSGNIEIIDYDRWNYFRWTSGPDKSNFSMVHKFYITDKDLMRLTKNDVVYLNNFVSNNEDIVSILDEQFFLTSTYNGSGLNEFGISLPQVDNGLDYSAHISLNTKADNATKSTFKLAKLAGFEYIDGVEISNKKNYASIDLIVTVSSLNTISATGPGLNEVYKPFIKDKNSGIKVTDFSNATVQSSNVSSSIFEGDWIDGSQTSKFRNVINLVATQSLSIGLTGSDLEIDLLNVNDYDYKFDDYEIGDVIFLDKVLDGVHSPISGTYVVNAFTFSQSSAQITVEDIAGQSIIAGANGGTFSSDDPVLFMPAHRELFTNSTIRKGFFRRSLMKDSEIVNEDFRNETALNTLRLVEQYVDDTDNLTIKSGLYYHSFIADTTINESVIIRSGLRNNQFNTGIISESFWMSGTFSDALPRKIEVTPTFKTAKQTTQLTNGESDGYSTAPLYIPTAGINSNEYSALTSLISTPWFVTNIFELPNLWMDGNWNSGLMVDSHWMQGEWQTGLFKKSVWRDGNWYNGILGFNNLLAEDTLFRRGNWHSGIVIKGIIGPENADDASVVWHTGIFTDGVFYANGTGSTATWKKGTFNNGEVVSDGLGHVTWEDGTFNNGIFHPIGNASGLDGNGVGSSAYHWLDGKFNGGVFGNGNDTYTGAYHENSYWFNGEFNSGAFQGRVWNNGVFTGGKFLGNLGSDFITNENTTDTFLPTGDHYGLWRNGIVDPLVRKDQNKIKTRANKVAALSARIDFRNVLWESGVFNAPNAHMKESIWLSGEFNSGHFDYSNFNPYVNRFDTSDGSGSTMSYNLYPEDAYLIADASPICIWNNGIFNDGEFSVSEWNNGIIENGTFSTALIRDGLVKFGCFYNSIWEDGRWRNGTWNGSPFDISDITAGTSSGLIDSGKISSQLITNMRRNNNDDVHLWNIFENTGACNYRLNIKDSYSEIGQLSANWSFAQRLPAGFVYEATLGLVGENLPDITFTDDSMKMTRTATPVTSDALCVFKIPGLLEPDVEYSIRTAGTVSGQFGSASRIFFDHSSSPPFGNTISPNFNLGEEDFPGYTGEAFIFSFTYSYTGGATDSNLNMVLDLGTSGIFAENSVYLNQLTISPAPTGARQIWGNGEAIRFQTFGNGPEAAPNQDFAINYKSIPVEQQSESVGPTGATGISKITAIEGNGEFSKTFSVSNGDTVSIDLQMYNADSLRDKPSDSGHGIYLATEPDNGETLGLTGVGEGIIPPDEDAGNHIGIINTIRSTTEVIYGALYNWSTTQLFQGKPFLFASDIQGYTLTPSDVGRGFVSDRDGILREILTPVYSGTGELGVVLGGPPWLNWKNQASAGGPVDAVDIRFMIIDKDEDGSFGKAMINVESMPSVVSTNSINIPVNYTNSGQALSLAVGDEIEFHRYDTSASTHELESLNAPYVYLYPNVGNYNFFEFRDSDHDTHNGAIYDGAFAYAGHPESEDGHSEILNNTEPKILKTKVRGFITNNNPTQSQTDITDGTNQKGQQILSKSNPKIYTLNTTNTGVPPVFQDSQEFNDTGYIITEMPYLGSGLLYVYRRPTYTIELYNDDNGTLLFKGDSEFFNQINSIGIPWSAGLESHGNPGSIVSKYICKSYDNGSFGESQRVYRDMADCILPFHIDNNEVVSVFGPTPEYDDAISIPDFTNMADVNIVGKLDDLGIGASEIKSKIGNGDFRKGLWEFGVWNNGIRSSNKVVFDYVVSSSLFANVSGNKRTSRFQLDIYGPDYAQMSNGDKVVISNIVAIDINGKRRLIQETFDVLKVEQVDTNYGFIRVFAFLDYPVRTIRIDSELHKIYVSKNIWMNGAFLNGIFGKPDYGTISDNTDDIGRNFGDVWLSGIIKGSPNITVFSEESHIVDGIFSGGYFNSVSKDYKDTAGQYEFTKFNSGLIQNTFFIDNNKEKQQTFETVTNSYNSYLDLTYSNPEKTRLYKDNYNDLDQLYDAPPILQWINTDTAPINTGNHIGRVTNDVLSSFSSLRDKDAFKSSTYRLGSKSESFGRIVGDTSNNKNISLHDGTFDLAVSDPSVIGLTSSGVAFVGVKENSTINPGGMELTFANSIQSNLTNGGTLKLVNDKEGLFTDHFGAGTFSLNGDVSIQLVNYEATGSFKDATKSNRNDWISSKRYSMIKFDVVSTSNSATNVFLDLADTKTFVITDDNAAQLFLYNEDQNLMKDKGNTKTVYFYNRTYLNLFKRTINDTDIEIDNIEYTEQDMIPFFKYYDPAEINGLPTPTFVSKSVFIDFSDDKMITRRSPNIEPDGDFTPQGITFSAGGEIDFSGIPTTPQN